MCGAGARLNPRGRRWGLLPALTLLAGAFLAPADAAEEYTYPRLSLGTILVDRWITVKNNPEFLSRFQEIYTSSPAENILDTREMMENRGYGTWLNRVRFVQIITPLCAVRAVPEADGKLPAWMYYQAKNNLGALLTVATYHNLRQHGCDWLLHDTRGDTMCVWGSTCDKVLLNISQWCPKGEWDGRVSKVTPQGLKTWDYGSTVGLNVVEWMCTVVRDSLYLHNETFAEAFDGLQIEDSLGRDLVCAFGYNPQGQYNVTPDPRRDGIGFACTEAWESPYVQATWPQIDSLMTYFLQPIRDAGFFVRGNGSNLRWLFDQQYYYEEDTLYTDTFSGAKFEQYGAWAGWPYSDSTRGDWFHSYQGVEDVYHPRNIDGVEGWDVSVIQSNAPVNWSDSRREKWARLNLGQCLMGDGFFDGQAYLEDSYFLRYITETGSNWAQYEPTWVGEMGLVLGQAVGGCQEYRSVPNARPLYYRHFRDRSGGQNLLYTVVVNIWPVELADVPARDALWYHGHHTQFPLSRAQLVFNRRPGAQYQPTWAVLRAGGSPLDLSVRFDLPESREVALAVYDLNGRKVRTLLDRRMDAGPAEVTWRGDDDHGRRVARGLYFWKLLAGDLQCRGRLILLR